VRQFRKELLNQSCSRQTLLWNYKCKTGFAYPSLRINSRRELISQKATNIHLIKYNRIHIFRKKPIHLCNPQHSHPSKVKVVSRLQAYQPQSCSASMSIYSSIRCQSKLMCDARRDMTHAWSVAARDMPKLRFFK